MCRLYPNHFPALHSAPLFDTVDGNVGNVGNVGDVGNVGNDRYYRFGSIIRGAERAKQSRFCFR